MEGRGVSAIGKYLVSPGMNLSSQPVTSSADVGEEGILKGRGDWVTPCVAGVVATTNLTCCHLSL